MELFQLLEKIKERPGLYLGKKSIVNLRSFLDGYYFALMENGLCKEDEISLWKDFQNYIQSRYKIKSSQDWSSIILFFSTDESEGLDNFFNLFENFYRSRNYYGNG